MRVLLVPFGQPGVTSGLVYSRELITDDVLLGFVGNPVLDRPGDGRRIGTVRRAIVDDTGVWGDLELTEPRLPHELAVDLGNLPSIRGVKQ